MFYTARPPWQCQHVSPNPISPPALHNARYAGWPRPPIQLPRVIDAPSRPYEVTAAHAQLHPYATHPSINAGAQASADMTGPVDSQSRNVPNSWTWSGAARAQSLHGPSEMHTITQHNAENALLIYDHSGRRAMPLKVNDTPNASLHPFLALPSVSFTYDLRYPPTSLRFQSSSLFAGSSYELLRVPLTPERPTQILLISPEFPWAFNIGTSAGEEIVTCLDVLVTLYAALQRPLTDAEWATAGDHKRASLLRARNRRTRMQPAFHGSSDYVSRTGPTVRFAPGAYAPNHRLVQREPPLLRVDWLGSNVAFMGLVKDEAFARSSLIPGGGERPEKWVVRFQRL
ncbi:hypothetical protein DEU56DRAFT_388107 [Suillus clintonianus]|uniref:uncharacterized protein n=1 Tax=Suillus clintonianus TaxID=1904413 RepID=UPI001B85DBDF|nr:uncharacterized protein DEU56DRAFT_388107 [Suillus clintonianus]KAG2135766.1 hypothetical protein DEU56DRAFT_388107 [Suillus clintonianus]